MREAGPRLSRLGNGVWQSRPHTISMNCSDIRERSQPTTYFIHNHGLKENSMYLSIVARQTFSSDRSLSTRAVERSLYRSRCVSR
jgi:hypothetical protein